MTDTVDSDLLVPRTCTVSDEKSSTRASRPLADFRDAPAYVLLGDPGAGKTESFKQESAIRGGHYIRARSFVALDPSSELAGKTLFIDGLDEMRAGGSDGRTPLDCIARHLDRLGRPRFRLSCREADWYGDSDSAALLEIAPRGSLAVLHLDPLSEEDVVLLLERKFGIADPAGFVHQADRHGLADLLRNPQTLRLLANAVGGEAWPTSREATYDLACRQLTRETNPEHRQAKRTAAPTTDELLIATSFLCAVHLLAGIAGFALDDDATDDQHVLLRELPELHGMPWPAALESNLFQHGDREQQRIPVHRSIAEFLGARHLATLIENRGLPLGRVVALMAGDDGGIVSDLRGLAAWLAVYSRSARAELIARDPLAVVLYGNVRDFPPEDKRRVLAALKSEAERYANFRFEDWTAAPFGSLATPDMVPVFLELLVASSRSDTDMALLDCVLDALVHGPPLTELTESLKPVTLAHLETALDAVVRDASYPSHIRHAALRVLLSELPRNARSLVALADRVLAGDVEDSDDRILGLLLRELYPQHITPKGILGYLHHLKLPHHSTSYDFFWDYGLVEATPHDDLPLLLDQLIQQSPIQHRVGKRYEFSRMAGSLLARGVEEHGDAVMDHQLYDWLVVGLDEYELPRVDNEYQERIARWLSSRPERYKAILIEGALRCIGKENVPYCLYQITSRLYGAEPPIDIISWYLEQAGIDTHVDLAQHYFGQAVMQLVHQCKGQSGLTLDAIEFMEPWVAAHPEFQAQWEGFTSCPINDWRKDHAARNRAWHEERKHRKEDWRQHFRHHLTAIRDGSAHPKILHDLAQVYLIQHLDVEGETPQERIADFLGEDRELIEAAYSGFRRSLERNDLPSVTDIIDLETKGHMHFIRQVCLVGIMELYRDDPAAALCLGDDVLRKLLAFQFTWGMDEDHAWFVALVKTKPTLAAEILVVYALSLLRKGREHLYGIWQLANDDDYAEVARAALPDLLKGFPLRAKNRILRNVLDPLLKAGLRYLDRPTLDNIISARLTQESMSAAQRVHWLACGLILYPRSYEAALAQHVGSSKALAAHLGDFIHDGEKRYHTLTGLPESTFGLLIELLAPSSPAERPFGAHWVSPAMQTADQVRVFINAIGGNPSAAAGQELERLLALPKLASWYGHLRHAIHTQRIARRKANFRRLDAITVCRTLANRQPSNAADLAALAYDHLRDLARKIRDDSTNDYRQYWSLDESNKKPLRSKPENDCRDALLSDLAERLGRLGVDAIKEGYYAEEKRADIRVSSGGAAGFNVPIEIKKDSHDDLWRAMHEQLIKRYTRDPGTDGFGIYLVFWFGGKNMPLPQSGKKPRNAAELEEQLRSMLTQAEARQIGVCVIDCSLP